jgi:hypothetical protein
VYPYQLVDFGHQKIANHQFSIHDIFAERNGTVLFLKEEGLKTKPRKNYEISLLFSINKVFRLVLCYQSRTMKREGKNMCRRKV